MSRANRKLALFWVASWASADCVHSLSLYWILYVIREKTTYVHRESSTRRSQQMPFLKSRRLKTSSKDHLAADNYFFPE